jgi:hypothetical protein
MVTFVAIVLSITFVIGITGMYLESKEYTELKNDFLVNYSSEETESRLNELRILGVI